jgi:hypothetical protein
MRSGERHLFIGFLEFEWIEFTSLNLHREPPTPNTNLGLVDF